MKLMKLTQPDNRGHLYLNPANIIAVKANISGSIIVTTGCTPAGIALDYSVNETLGDIAAEFAKATS